MAEAAGTGTFTVVLQSQPTADVTIAVSSDATGNATVSPATLTFTSGNWATAQTVTVTGVNDDIATGDRSANIVLAAATSTDASYSALDPADVAVTVTDDDAAGITVSEATLTVAEAAGTGTFTVVLQSQPTADVTIAVSSDATGNATVSPATLTFTSAQLGNRPDGDGDRRQRRYRNGRPQRQYRAGSADLDRR